MRVKPAKAIVIGTFVALGIVGYLMWPHIQIRYWCWQLRRNSGNEDGRWSPICNIEHHQSALWGMGRASFYALVGPEPTEGSGWPDWRPARQPFQPKAYDAFDFAGMQHPSAQFRAIFLSDRLISICRLDAASDCGPDEIPRSNLMEDGALAAGASLNNWSDPQQALPTLFSYLGRCPDLRSQKLCCWSLHEITHQDLPPTPEAWAAWWAKRKPPP